MTQGKLCQFEESLLQISLKDQFEGQEKALKLAKENEQLKRAIDELKG